METRTGAEKYLADRRNDPEFEADYQRELRRIAQFDMFIEDLNKQRKSLGWTKAELARRSDIPATAIRRLFSQRHKNPTLSTLTALADALGAKIVLVSNDVNEATTEN